MGRAMRLARCLGVLAWLLASGQAFAGVVSLGSMKPLRSILPSRPIFAWLPPGYEGAQRRYPVLYVLDGQNQFDPKRAYAGVTWGLDKSGEAHVRAGHQPFIAVAVDNALQQRSDEYLPSRARQESGAMVGGKLGEFAAFLINQVKPAVDREFRTKTGPEDTAVLGSSFGGSAAFHLGFGRPDKFRRVAAVSAPFWWNGGEALKLVKSAKKKPPIRLWIDMGTREDVETADAARKQLEGAREMKSALLKLGFKEGRDLGYLEDEGAAHSEAAWAQRLPDILRFLFP